MSDPWKKLRAFTQARIGLPRAGHAVATRALLDFQRAHAEAREAVWRAWDYAKLAAELGEATLIVRSQVSARADYLRRPDLGRLLNAESAKILAPQASLKADLVFVISDGLSARAIEDHALKFWKVLAPRLVARGFVRAPLILAPFARVALADEIGEALHAQMTVILIGERPGLSSADSLGVYLTYNPRRGNHDAQRNCISNIREPGGLSYQVAAEKLMYLIEESLRLKLSGVNLKEAAGETLAGTQN